ncbi:sigma-70 family RNA polymerase sigma factor [Streptomyces sp. NPDC046853]|uniref:RNA polymerase sigma factor n=1 Tax=Streptomyces sp. NPDC046853 TaxID=3154920 RepID=UPI003406BB53
MTGSDEGAPGESMRDFYERMYPKLMARAYMMCGSRQDAEDVVQDAFVAVLPRWAQYSSYETPEAVVHRAMVQRVWKMRQRRARWLGRLKDVVPPEAVWDPQISAETSEVLEALRELPLRQRAVLVLHALAGFSSQEIADELEISVDTVRTHKYRGREKLKCMLGMEGRDADRPEFLPSVPAMALSMLPPNTDQGGEDAAEAAVRRAGEELHRRFEADHTARERMLAALEAVAARQARPAEAEE